VNAVTSSALPSVVYWFHTFPLSKALQGMTAACTFMYELSYVLKSRDVVDVYSIGLFSFIFTYRVSEKKRYCIRSCSALRTAVHSKSSKSKARMRFPISDPSHISNRFWNIATESSEIAVLAPFSPSVAIHSADYVVARCPSVCLSVRHTPVFYRNGEALYISSYFLTVS